MLTRIATLTRTSHCLDPQSKSGLNLSVSPSTFDTFAQMHEGELVMNTTEVFLLLAIHATWADYDERAEMMARVLRAPGNTMSKVRYERRCPCAVVPMTTGDAVFGDTTGPIPDHA